MKTPWFPNSSAPYTHWGGGVVFKFTKAGPTQDLLADTPQGPEAPQPSLLSAKQGKAAAAGRSRARPQKGESLPAQG